MKKFPLILLALAPFALQGQSLQVVASAGPHYSDHRFVITATVGETCINTSQGAATQATEGFQQGFRAPATVLTAAEEPETPRLQAVLFPNPATERLQVSLQNAGDQPIRLQIYDRLGKLVREAETTAGEQVFGLETLPAGQYWLAIRPSGQHPGLTLPFEKIRL